MFESSDGESPMRDNSKRQRRRVVSSSEEESAENNKTDLSQIVLPKSAVNLNASENDEDSLSDTKITTNVSSRKSGLLTLSDIESDTENPALETKCDKDSLSDENPSTKTTINVPFSKSALLTLSDVDSDAEDIALKANNNNKKSRESSGSESAKEEVEKSKKKQRKKNKKVDNKLAIRSETQRLERERVVDIPCHRPKQRSLREFLARRKNNQSIKLENLRSTSTKMIPIWKEIDQSTREIAEFFKPESSEEELETEVETSGPVLPIAETEYETTGVIIPKETENETPNVALPNETTASEVCAEAIKTNSCSDEIMEAVPIDESATVVCPNVSITPAPTSPVMPHPLESEVPKEITDTNGVEVNIKNISSPVANSTEELPNVSSHSKTLKWLEDNNSREQVNRFNKLQLSPTLLEKVPVLSASDDFIDFGDKASELKLGAKQLMDRLLNGRKSGAATGVTTLTTTQTDRDASGNITGVTTEIITLAALETTKGQKFQKFKELIRNEIEAKWEKQCQQRAADLKGKDGFEEEVDDVEGEEEVENVESDDSCETESEPEEENDVEIRDKPRKFCDFGDSEAEESADDGDDEGPNDEDDQNDDNDGDQDDLELEDKTEGGEIETADNDFEQSQEIDCSVLPAYQPGGGLLMGGSTLTQLSQPLPINLFSPVSSPAVSVDHGRTPRTPVSLTPRVFVTPRTGGKNQETPSIAPKKNLFGSDRYNFDDDDPFLFVSGAFPDSNPASVKAVPASGVPADNIPASASTQNKPKRIILPEGSDDSRSQSEAPRDIEEELYPGKSDNDEKETTHADIFSSAKKKQHRLVYSDDEDDPVEQDLSDDDVKSTKEPADNLEDLEEPEPAEVDYDSEENELVPAKPSDYFEQEAELSESEWSGDEDEGGLDRLEAEAGDADVLDQNELASQLGRIHARQLADEDARDVRLIQELLFEDGDLHGEGKQRDRKFRWKNLAGFELDENRGVEDGSDVEDDGDTQLAKDRHDKAVFFQQMEKDGKLNKIEEVLSQGEDPVLQLGRELLQQQKPRPVLATINKALAARGSFLSKDNAFLTRVAKVTGVAVGGGTLGPSHSRNFVFTAQDKETSLEVVNVVKEGVKRKAFGCQETVKRVKLTSCLSAQPSLLDQLR